MPKNMITCRLRIVFLLVFAVTAGWAQTSKPSHAIVLHAARLLDVESGRVLSPGEVLVEGERIAEVGKTVKHPAGAEIIDLGDRTLLPGLIDAHIHLFLHPGAEDLQTVQESVPQRTIMATLAARDDLMAGFTAERDMGTEGAGPADTAVRDAIDRGQIPGPRLRISGTRSIFSAGMKTPSATTQSSTFCPMPLTPTMRISLSRRCASNSNRVPISSRFTRLARIQFVMAASQLLISTPRLNSVLQFARRLA